MDFNFIHLSDFHWGEPTVNKLWSNLEKAIFDDISGMAASCGPWHAIIFTGDLVYSGKKVEYSSLNPVLDKLFHHLKKLGSTPILITIPGNHDIQRPAPEKPAVRFLSESDEKAINSFWEQPNSPYRKSAAYRKVLWRHLTY